VEGESLPIQDPTVRSVPVPAGVYKGPQTRPALGPSKRYYHLRLPGRHTDYWSLPRTDSTVYTSGPKEVSRARLLGKGVKVHAGTDPEDRTPRVHNRHGHYDSISPEVQDTRLEERGIQAPVEDVGSPSHHSGIRGESYGDDHGSLPGKDDDTPTHTADEPGPENEMQMDGLNYHQSTSTGRAPMVEATPLTVERSVIPSPDHGRRHIYGLLRQPLGDGDQRDDIPRSLVTTRSQTTYQLEGTPMHLAGSQLASVSRTHGQHHLRQHDRHILYQQVWRNEVGTFAFTRHQDLATLSLYRNTLEDYFRSITLQSSGRTFEADDSAAGMVNCPGLLSLVGPTMGPSSRGPVPVSPEQQSPMIRFLEAPPDSVQDGCPSTSMALVGLIVDLSSMEPDTEGSPSDPRESDFKRQSELPIGRERCGSQQSNRWR
jgi:hypothetical protein